MNKLVLALILAVSLIIPSVVMALGMPEVEGEFMYLPVAQVMTLGAGANVADFSRDDSATPMSIEALPMKVLYSSSLKASVAWNISGDNRETGLIPDYGGLKASIDAMKLFKNMGATGINTDVALSIDGGLLFDIKSLLDSPAVLRLEPAIGASIKIKF